MPVDITTYELLDGANQLAASKAAVRYCQASEALGYDRARYYWEHGHRLVIISEAEDARAFANADVVTGETTTERAEAGFELEDLTRWVETRRLLDDQQGKLNTRLAGRSDQKQST
jgi:hypothetical protein